MLEIVDLTDAADRLAATYSGGMVRRLELAQALVNRPALLMLDEPTIGLDPIARHQRVGAVQQMQERYGMTVLVTTHYMDEADQYCDRVALMHRGPHARARHARTNSRPSSDPRPAWRTSSATSPARVSPTREGRLPRCP